MESVIKSMPLKWRKNALKMASKTERRKYVCQKNEYISITTRVASNRSLELFIQKISWMHITN